MFSVDSYIAAAYRAFFDLDQEAILVETERNHSSHVMFFRYKFQDWRVCQSISCDASVPLSQHLLTEGNPSVNIWVDVYLLQRDWATGEISSELEGTNWAMDCHFELRTILAALQFVKEIMDGGDDGGEPDFLPITDGSPEGAGIPETPVSLFEDTVGSRDRLAPAYSSFNRSSASRISRETGIPKARHNLASVSTVVFLPSSMALNPRWSTSAIWASR